MRFNSATLSLILSLPGLSSAITYGEPDGDRHPQVGMLVAFNDTNPVWRCSGTLLSKKIFVTAGHCIPRQEIIISGESFGYIQSVELLFEEDLSFLPGGSTREWPNQVAEQVREKSDASSKKLHPHPEYNDITFEGPDVGVVVLNKPYDVANYAILPDFTMEQVMDTVEQKKDLQLENVGYGGQIAHPNDEEKDIFLNMRMVSYSKVLQLVKPGDWFNKGDGQYYMWGSANANAGGTCYGDSGGPAFLDVDGYDPLTIVGITSWGHAVRCKDGTAYTRLDHPDVLPFVKDFLQV